MNPTGSAGPTTPPEPTLASAVLREQRRLVRCFVAILLGGAVLGGWMMVKIERLIRVAENVDSKVERFMQAGAPLGRAAVEKGVAVIQGTDPEQIREGAPKMLRDAGRAVMDAAKDTLKEKDDP